MSKKYHILCLERGAWGNDAVWWQHNDHGYTSHLEEAGIYTEQEAKERVTEEDIALPVSDVAEMRHQAVAFGKATAYIKRFPRRAIKPKRKQWQ